MTLVYLVICDSIFVINQEIIFLYKYIRNYSSLVLLVQKRNGKDTNFDKGDLHLRNIVYEGKLTQYLLCHTYDGI